VSACMNSRTEPNLNAAAPAQQTGAVLILALLIVALVAGLGIKFAGDYQLGLARAESRWFGTQARIYAFSAEGTAVKMLSQDSPEFDSALDETWGQEIPLEVEGGGLLIKITDANGQFNLNYLGGDYIADKPVGDPARYSEYQRMFIRLLLTFSPLVADSQQAADILEAIVDWADTNNTPSDIGAEDSYYLSLPEPYLPANVPFRSVEELQMVRGITPELMRALRPYITVLPSTMPMNVNTMQGANADPRLYRCINLINTFDPLTEEQAARLIPPQGQPYKQMQEFLTVVGTVIGTASGVKGDTDLSVNTDLFWLTTRVEVGNQRRTGRSLLQRGTPVFKVVRREDVF
jgi:general secretion pathway protein K